jgi:ribosomal protein S18 acetylase RimI-like enzyme
LLAHHGYTLDDDYTYVMMRCSLARSLPRPQLAPGFTIRPLAGLGEVDAYAAVHRRAFESMSMTAAWRARTLDMPQYDPELDLVAVAPDGQLAGFCVGWATPERRVAQIEPFGVDPAFQGRGLGRALLLEMLGRFKAHGAEHAQVETDSGRTPARHAYTAVGLLPTYQSLRKGQWFSQHDSSQG